MAKKASKEQVREARAKRAADHADDTAEATATIEKARADRDEALTDEEDARREEELKAAEEDEDADEAQQVTLHDGKPGSGAGLKPGDWHAPASNPGAAARVPTQPLQPESLQSHGKGILHDKDLDNGAFASGGDPSVVDQGPFGTVGEEATLREAEKADKATARFKQRDPDNPTIGGGGRKDATASPNPIGSSRRSKNAVPGGSNSGHQS
jgi:hypothetical protein